MPQAKPSATKKATGAKPSLAFKGRSLSKSPAPAKKLTPKSKPVPQTPEEDSEPDVSASDSDDFESANTSFDQSFTGSEMSTDKR
jgi:hypothetical protein